MAKKGSDARENSEGNPIFFFPSPYFSSRIIFYSPFYLDAWKRGLNTTHPFQTTTNKTIKLSFFTFQKALNSYGEKSYLEIRLNFGNQT